MPEIFAELKAVITDFQAKMAAARGEMDETEKKGSSSLGIGGMGGAVAGGLLAVGTIAVGIGIKTMKMAADFQSSMTMLVTGAGESQKNIKMVSDGILAMAPKVGETTQQLAAGMYLIESAGYHGAAGLSVLHAAAEGAKVGNADLATVAGAVTTALTDYHLPASQAADVTSALVQTVADGKTNMEDLGQSLGKVMPQAAALGISFAEVTGAMATMTNAGLSARLASQHLSNSILALSAPGATASKAMAGVGLSAQQVKDTMTGPSGLAGAIALIEQHVGSTFPAGSVASVNAFKNIMGGATGYSTALMLGGKNMAAYQANVVNINQALNKNSQTVQGWSKVQGDANQQVDEAKARIQVLGIQIGQKLIPIVAEMVQGFAKFISFISAHWDTIKILATIMIFVLGGAILQLALHWKALWDGMKTATQDFVGFFTAIPGEIVGFFSGVANRIYNTFVAPLISFMTAIPNKITNLFANVGNGIVGFFTGIPGQIWSQVIQPIWTAFVSLPDSIARLFLGLGKHILESIVSGLGGAASGLFHKVLGAFQEGGLVPGSGPQLAIVHGGEYVLTQQDVGVLTQSGGAGTFGATNAGAGGAGGAGGDLVLQIDGQTFARLAGPAFRYWLNTTSGRNGVVNIRV